MTFADAGFIIKLKFSTETLSLFFYKNLHGRDQHEVLLIVGNSPSLSPAAVQGAEALRQSLLRTRKELEMAKLEDVLAGLRSCNRFNGVTCAECPYQKENRSIWPIRCRQMLYIDAINLIEKQLKEIERLKKAIAEQYE